MSHASLSTVSSNGSLVLSEELASLPPAACAHAVCALRCDSLPAPAAPEKNKTKLSFVVSANASFRSEVHITHSVSFWNVLQHMRLR